jgi:hypothetical protein
MEGGGGPDGFCILAQIEVFRGKQQEGNKTGHRVREDESRVVEGSP